MEFRTATPADAVAVQRVAREAWHAVHAPIIGVDAVEDMLTEWYDRDDLETAIRDDDATMILAVEEEVIGFAEGGPSEDGPADAVVGRLYVHPDRWRAGIGTELLSRLFADLRTRNYDSVWLAVMAENDVAHGFYEKHGFEIYQQRTIEHVGHEIEDRILVREL